jgi:DNA-binding CsgD family transcriptional regulator
LAVALPADERAAIAVQLCLAEIDALWLDDALASAHETMRLFDLAGVPASRRATFLADVVTGLHDGGQASSLWSPLLYTGLSLVPEDDEITWARLTLLIERFEPVTYGTMHGARWLGTDRRAVEIAWESGDESLIARSLQPWDLWDRERTRELSELVGTWQNPSAVIRALMVCGADWLYHHGDFRRALAHFGQLLRFAEHQESVPGMAEACVRLGIVHTALGNLEQAQRFESLATGHVQRLGEGHRLKASLWWLRALLADYQTEPDEELAELFFSYLSDPATAQRTIAFDDAALTVHLLARTGQRERAQPLLAQVVEVLPRLEPRLWLLNGTVAFAGSAAWILKDHDAAPRIRDSALAVLEGGHDDFPCSSIWLTVARMAWLAGDADESAAAFGRARSHLEASDQRPLRAIVDHDEALTLVDGTFGARLRAYELAMKAHDQFVALGMTGWRDRAAALLGTLSEHGAADRALPGGLTPREIDVLRLLAQGYSDSQIAREIFVSTRTVNTHVRNILAKTHVRNRAALTGWAIGQGLIVPAPGQVPIS